VCHAGEKSQFFCLFWIFSVFFVSIDLHFFNPLFSINLPVPTDLQNFTPLNSIDLLASGAKMTKIQNFTPLIFFKIVKYDLNMLNIYIYNVFSQK
jgi:hypothetical protein